MLNDKSARYSTGNLCVIECESRNGDVQLNIKMCVLDTMSDWVGKVDRKARKPYITEEIISKHQ